MKKDDRLTALLEQKVKQLKEREFQLKERIENSKNNQKAYAHYENQLSSVQIDISQIEGFLQTQK